MSETDSDADDRLDREKEVKVKIPLGIHLKLHSMKVITGQHISDTVTEALESYFEQEEDVPAELQQEGSPLEFLQ
jgi:hypothetical protein